MSEQPEEFRMARFAMPDTQWQELKSQYSMTDRDIVDVFIRPFLLEASQTKSIQFVEDPRLMPERSLLGEQWRILRDDQGYVFDESTGRAVLATREEIEGLL
jgi:hypothetical protein